MTACRCGIYLSLALLIACAPGCKEHDPSPSHNADLGEEGRPLVPTSAPVHNFKIKNGSADWQPFRRPEIPDDTTTPTRGSAVSDHTTPNGETEKAIREAVVDYNDALMTGTIDDLLEFFTEDQGKIAEAVLPTLESLNTKLGELATAIPDQAKTLETLRTDLAAAQLLRIDIASIKTAGKNAATVTLKRSPLPAFLPGLSDDAKTAKQVTFLLGKDEYWYIQSPILTALATIEPALKQVIAEVDGLASDKGNADAATALAATKTLFPMLQAVAAMAEDAPKNTTGNSPDGADKNRGG